MRARQLLGALAIGAVACAAVIDQTERRDYILAHPHGWIELTVADESIPMVPLSEENANTLTNGLIVTRTAGQAQRTPPAMNAVSHMSVLP